MVFQMGDLRPSDMNDRIVDRKIGGQEFRFMLKRVDERVDMQHRIYAVSELLTDIGDAFGGDLLSMFGEDKVEGAERIARIVQIATKAGPAVLKKFAEPQYKELVNDLVGWSMIFQDGEYRRLSDANVHEAAFHDDLLLRYPVAWSALQVNFGNEIKKLVAAFRSSSAATAGPQTKA